MTLVDVANMMVGPGKMRWAPVGTDDTLIVAGGVPTWAAAWTEVGATDGGVKLAVAKDYTNHEIDQVADWVASTINSRHTTVQTDLVETGNLAKLSLVNNGGVSASVNASWDKYEPNVDLIATQETYIMVAVEGKTLAGKSWIGVCRRVLNVDSVQFEFKKDGKTMYSLSFAGHYVDDTHAPFVIYKQK
jgi:hypothetical protein